MQPNQEFPCQVLSEKVFAFNIYLAAKIRRLNNERENKVFYVLWRSKTDVSSVFME